MRFNFIYLLSFLFFLIIHCTTKTNVVITKPHLKNKCNLILITSDKFIRNESLNSTEGIAYNGIIKGALIALYNGSYDYINAGMKYKIFDNDVYSDNGRYKAVYVNFKAEHCWDTTEVLRLLKNEMEQRHKLSWRYVVQEVEQWKWKVVDTTKLYNATFRNKDWGFPGRIRHVTFMNDTINVSKGDSRFDSLILIQELHLEWLALKFQYKYKEKESKGNPHFEPIQKLYIDVSDDSIFQDTSYVYDIAIPKYLIFDYEHSKSFLYEKLGIECTRLPTKYVNCIEIFRFNN